MGAARPALGAVDASSADSEVRSVLLRARPLLEEVLSLWPAEKRPKLVLWVDLVGTEVQVKARLRDGERQVRRVKGDAAIVVELPGKATVVIALQAVRAAA
jgi:hypothetical protein